MPLLQAPEEAIVEISFTITRMLVLMQEQQIHLTKSPLLQMQLSGVTNNVTDEGEIKTPDRIVRGAIVSHFNN